MIDHPSTRILGVTDIYPSPYRPEEGIFIQSLFHELYRKGCPVKVLNPRSRLKTMVTSAARRSTGRKDSKTGEEILTPGYLTVSSRLFSWNNVGGRLTLQYYRQAVERSLPRAIEGCGWIYAHFLRSGWAAIDVCDALQRDCFIALGESNLKKIIDLIGSDTFAKLLPRFAGVITVSRANEALCRDYCPALGDRLIYLPNAVDHTLFFPYDRAEARRKLHLPADARIVVFCGHFIERKGVQRLSAALERLPDVHGIFLGRGPETPKGSRVLYAGPVDHSMVPWWLSAADLFALPSIAEGMSNAIIEALACGLPVVVSDLPFNHEFLEDDCALFVDPFSTDEIAKAIVFLFENRQRYLSMVSAALLRADRFKLATRADSILDFVAEHIRKGPAI